MVIREVKKHSIKIRFIFVDKRFINIDLVNVDRPITTILKLKKSLDFVYVTQGEDIAHKLDDIIENAVKGYSSAFDAISFIKYGRSEFELKLVELTKSILELYYKKERNNV